jgi:hexosaminidase
MKCVFCIALVLLSFCGFSQSVIPAPYSVKRVTGSFTFNALTTVTADEDSRKTVGFFTDYLKRSWKFRTGHTKNQVIITSRGAEQLPAEGYRLSITPFKIILTGKGAGLFYGVQTLIQLFPDEKRGTADLPCITIEDHPRFGYRGLMLDVSRHFFTVQQVKDLLDLMAYYKLNRFHWHLTDDQGWRLEIKRYPKLTSVGAWRVKRVGDFGGNMEPPRAGEPAIDGGFYTQEDVKEIVRYAADRHIQIVPEIDVPGHSMAAVAAYPELSVTKKSNTRVNPGSSFAKWFPDGHFEMYEDNTLNPADENVYRFLDKVFTEVAALFPYEYIHIGGDECFKGYWEKDSSVQAFMRQYNIATVHQLQRYFISRLNTIIRSKHKKLIGWDEILDGELQDDVTIMNRFVEKKSAEQIGKNLNIILAPGNSGLYFDYAQSSSDMEPINHGGNSPWWKAYNFNPSLNEQDRQHVLGVEGCIWTEHIPTVSKLQYMLLPRMLALAETAWSIQENKSYQRFADEVLPVHLARFDAADFNYQVPTVFNEIDTTIKASSFLFDVQSPFPGCRIYYTLNNRHPGDADHEYTGPVMVPVLPGKKIILKTIVVTPAGRRSVVTRTVIDNMGEHH